MRIVRMQVKSLFGYIDHDVFFKDGAPTIISAYNGVGKTTLLRMIKALIVGDISALCQIDFKWAKLFIDKSNGEKEVINVSATEEKIFIWVDGTDNRIVKEREFIKADMRREAERLMNSDYLTRISSDSRVDKRNGRYIPDDLVSRRYGKPKNSYIDSYFDDLKRKLSPLFLDTKRLNGNLLRDNQRSLRFRTFENVDDYVRVIHEEYINARGNAISATQSTDVAFVKRILEESTSNTNVTLDEVQHQYERTMQDYDSLSSNGLAEMPEIDLHNISLPKAADDSTLLSVVNIFLSDVQNRMNALKPLNEKVKLLKEELDSKLNVSGKRINVDENGRLTVINEKRDSFGRLRVSQLSSGEQQIITIYVALLFVAHKGNLVLIDEPELSLHPQWQEAFIDDVMEIAKMQHLQLIIATHSPNIVADHCDLIVPLDSSSIESLTDSISSTVKQMDEDEDEYGVGFDVDNAFDDDYEGDVHD